VRDWIAAVGAKTAYIEPGSPWENGYCESFNGSDNDYFTTKNQKKTHKKCASLS
jgi:transposase InsO family protein